MMEFIYDFWELFWGTPFHEPFWFLFFTTVTFMLTYGRYLLFSGAYHYFFYKWYPKSFKYRIINSAIPDRRKMRQEIGRSAITSLIFSVLFAIIIPLWQGGYTGIYIHWGDFPWWYHPLSLVIAMFIHETYYYWMHRWMHQPKVFRVIHKWHHENTAPTSLTAFSFHPFESLLQGIIIPVLIIFLPMHLLVLFIFLMVMTISGTINHAGVEVYPKGFDKHWLGRWLIGATHHDLHHKQFRSNFGLYFTFWDKWMKTENPNFEKVFQEKTASKSGGKDWKV